MKKLSWNDVKEMFSMPNSAGAATLRPGKHDASKRGHRHTHNMSKGERKHAAFVKKTKQVTQ